MSGKEWEERDDAVGLFYLSILSSFLYVEMVERMKQWKRPHFSLDSLRQDSQRPFSVWASKVVAGGMDES